MKRILSLFLALIMSLSIVGCGQPSTDRESNEAKPSSNYPITITDQADRTITIDKKPERIVSGYYISTSLLIALDQKENLIGIEAKAGKRPIYKLSAPELIKLPNVGTAKEFDLEGCATLRPDLVILPMKLKNTVSTLEDLGITVLLINPEDQELLTEAIKLVAKATDSNTIAEQLLTFTFSQQKRLELALKKEEKPKVYLAGNSNMLSTAGNAMYQSDMINLAGGNNVANEINDKDWAIIDYEQLLAWDPEYIILASDAEYTCEDVLSDPNLVDCTAVSKGNVYQMPNKAEAWDSPVPSGILGSVWLSSILHPNICNKKECNEIIEEFYETFYDFQYNQI